MPLVIVESPFRSLVTPFLHYLDVMAPTEEGVITIVVLPEYVPRHWWDRLLYNQTANRVKRPWSAGPTRSSRTCPTDASATRRRRANDAARSVRTRPAPAIEAGGSRRHRW